MMRTVEQAASTVCHMSIPSGDATWNCVGDRCMAWRWHPLQADAAFVEAVKKAAIELKDETSSRTKAAKHVTANLAQYGLPDKPYRGFCGLAGKPEVT